MHGQSNAAYKLLVRAYRSVLRRMWLKEAVFTVTLGAATAGVIDREIRIGRNADSGDAPRAAASSERPAIRKDVTDPTRAEGDAGVELDGRAADFDTSSDIVNVSPPALTENLWREGMPVDATPDGRISLASLHARVADSLITKPVVAPESDGPAGTDVVIANQLHSWRNDTPVAPDQPLPLASTLPAASDVSKGSGKPSGIHLTTRNILVGGGNIRLDSPTSSRPDSSVPLAVGGVRSLSNAGFTGAGKPVPAAAVPSPTLFRPGASVFLAAGARFVSTPDFTTAGNPVMAAVASGPVGADGTYAYTHTVNPDGLFADPMSSVSRTLGRQTMLMLYFHDAAAPDMYNATEGAGGDGTWYNTLARNADTLRAYYAAMSGGKLDFDIQIVDVPITAKPGGGAWATNGTGSAQSQFLPGLGINPADYRYVLNFYQPDQQALIINPTISQGVAGLSGTPAPSGLTTSNAWFNYTNTYTVTHEVGHSMSWAHSGSILRNSGIPAYVVTDYTTGTYGAAPVTDDPISLPIGVGFGAYGDPYSLMGGAQGMTPRQKQSMGWLDDSHFANLATLITPGAAGTTTVGNATTGIIKLYDDMADMDVVIRGGGGTLQYGVANGYQDVYYNASFVRRGQAFDVDSIGDKTGHWVDYTQQFDFFYRSGAEAAPGYVGGGDQAGIGVELNGLYIGRLAVGQTMLEKGVGSNLFIIDGNNFLNPADGNGNGDSGFSNDLGQYTITNNPRDPNRYRSVWYEPKNGS